MVPFLARIAKEANRFPLARAPELTTEGLHPDVAASSHPAGASVIAGLSV